MAEKTFGHKLLQNLLFWVVLAIIFGSLLGRVLPEIAIVPFATFNDIFGKFLSFAVPLIIVGLVSPALADLGRGAGKWLLLTVAIAYGSTLFAGYATFGIGSVVLPGLLSGEKVSKLVEPSNAVASLMGENFDIPPLFGVMSALVLSFVLGIGMAALNTASIRNVFDEFRSIIMSLIKKVIVPCLPLYVFGTFLNMAKSGQILDVIAAMVKLILFSIALTVCLLLLQYVIAGAIARVNPFKALWNMMNAYATALGTSSSAATIPVTYQCTLKNGVAKQVAGFTIPLCATIHLGGSTVKITAFAMGLMYMTGMPVSFSAFAGFVAMLGIIMVAAPGVPGGAITASQAVLVSMLGFSDPMYSMMVALYIAIDSVGTATNVTGDGAIALVVNKFARNSVPTDQFDQINEVVADYRTATENK